MGRQHSNNAAVTLSVRVAPEVRDLLEELSDAMGRTKSFIAAEAISQYLALHAWQLKSIHKAVKKANRKNAKFVEHEEVVAWLTHWHEKDQETLK